MRRVCKAPSLDRHGPMHAPARLAEISEERKAGETPPPEAVRTFLRWFRAERRGRKIVAHIRSVLSALAIETEPDFEAAYIDSLIGFVSPKHAVTARKTLAAEAV